MELFYIESIFSFVFDLQEDMVFSFSDTNMFSGVYEYIELTMPDSIEKIIESKNKS